MNTLLWIVCSVMAMLLWSSTDLLVKSGIHSEPEEHTSLKISVSVGIVFFIIAFIYLVIRKEPFTIWESAVKYWPVTAFGIIYAIVNTISYNGYIYNEVSVESPVEGISEATSTILLIIVYLLIGRIDTISGLLTPLKTIGIIVILTGVISLSIIRNRESQNGEIASPQHTFLMRLGLGTLIYPVMFSAIDGLETVVTGICLDTTYGYAMPEGDAIIIMGMEYALFSLCFWLYILCKEKKIYNPFKKENVPRILGSIADNSAIVFYSYAMAFNSVSTDPILAAYPVLSMLGGRIIMKEQLSIPQYICLLGIIAGTVMVIAGTII